MPIILTVMQTVPVFNGGLFVAAEMIVAIILSLGFLAAYLIDRKLSAFRWWSVAYALIAVSIATTPVRIETPARWIEIANWLSLYAATIIAAYGMYREGESRIRPHGLILTSALLFVAIVGALGALDATPSAWAILGMIPIAFFVFAWIVLEVRDRPNAPFTWGFLVAVTGGAILIVVRAFWFAAILANKPATGPVPPIIIDQSFIMSIATVMVMVGLATALILRVALATVRRVREHSATDPMSGLLTRASFDERAAESLAVDVAHSFCAIILDIDHFKKVNDTFGHPVGDEVIACVGHVIGEAADQGKIAGRIGGEEFAILLRDSNLAAARLFAEAIRTRFATCQVDAHIPWPLTLSAGVTLRQQDEPLHALIARTDKALYAAKNSGRNRVMIAAFEMESPRDAQSA